MREHKFRGMDIAGNWHYGNLSVLPERVHDVPAGTYISNSAGCPFAYAVRSKTVGQYIGLKDKNGKEIYHHDLMRDKRGNIQIVLYSDRDCGWYIKPPNDTTHDECWHRNLNVIKIEVDQLEVIGNIHQGAGKVFEGVSDK